jgi:hypothetical protein
VFSICLRRERVERRCHIDETDKTSEKYYPKTLIIKIVQNHLLFLCIILLTLVFSDFADRIAGIRFVITIDYPCNVTRSITPINSIKIIITSQAKHQSINQSIARSAPHQFHHKSYRTKQPSSLGEAYIHFQPSSDSSHLLRQGVRHHSQ